MLLIKIKNHESHIEFLKNNIKTDLWYFVHIGIYNKIKCHNLNTYINSRTVRFEFNCINCVNSISPLWVTLSRYTDNEKVGYYKPLSQPNIVFIEEE